MSHLIRALAVGLAVILGVAFSGPANAVLWASKSNPLYGYENGVKFGKAYGNFVNEGGIYAQSRSYQYDLRPGGNKVRVETDYYFHEFDPSCGSGGGGVCWVEDVSLQTDATNSASWVFDYRRRGLHGAADAARGGMDICEIQAWSNDPCSPHAWATFSY